MRSPVPVPTPTGKMGFHATDFQRYVDGGNWSPALEAASERLLARKGGLLWFPAGPDYRVDDPVEFACTLAQRYNFHLVGEPGATVRINTGADVDAITIDQCRRPVVHGITWMPTQAPTYADCASTLRFKGTESWPEVTGNEFLGVLGVRTGGLGSIVRLSTGGGNVSGNSFGGCGASGNHVVWCENSHNQFVAHRNSFWDYANPGAVGGWGAWQTSTAYDAGDWVSNDSGKRYVCITAGTSASSGGPTGTASDITDGTAHWRFVYREDLGLSKVASGVWAWIALSGYAELGESPVTWPALGAPQGHVVDVAANGFDEGAQYHTFVYGGAAGRVPSTSFRHNTGLVQQNGAGLFVAHGVDVEAINNNWKLHGGGGGSVGHAVLLWDVRKAHVARPKIDQRGSVNGGGTLKISADSNCGVLEVIEPLVWTATEYLGTPSETTLTIDSSADITRQVVNGVEV